MINLFMFKLQLGYRRIIRIKKKVYFCRRGTSYPFTHNYNLLLAPDHISGIFAIHLI
jgi:hypothetical protein